MYLVIVVVEEIFIHSAVNAMKECIFEIGGNRILRVDSFSHLGHIITSNLNDYEHILQKPNCFIIIIVYFAEAAIHI